MNLLAVAAVDHPGGAETTLLRLLAGLRDRGWQITLTTPGPGPLAEQARESGVGWAALPVGALTGGSGLPALASWPTARRLAGSADVVYLNGGVCGRILPALAVRRAGRPRRVLHIHDMVRRVPPFWRLADVVLAASAAVAARLPGLRPEVVYPPADPEPAPAPAPWPNGSGPVIGFVGRFEPRKGVHDLIAAAPAIRQGAPGARVVLVGGEPYGTDPAYTAAVRQADGVECYPWHDNAPGLMRHLDVLVLPSREEPAGTVLAEAMAVGTPVVATRVDGLPEVVADGVSGRLVEPGDPAGLAAAVLEVLGERERFGVSAREHARRFHVSGYVDQVESLIRP